MDEKLWAVVLAGGSGTRFWPLSRERKPKQLLKVLGPQSLLRQAVDRVLPLTGPERVLVVAGRSHGRQVRRVLPDLPPENVLLEPVGRDTAAACGLGALWIKTHPGSRTETPIMAVLPSDHLISDDEAFRTDLLAAAAAARNGRRLITFGLRPDRPETGYGYLERGEEAGSFLGRTMYRLVSFKEKPDPATAERFLAQGGFFWNSGMFVWDVETILDWMDRLMPELGQGLKRLVPHLRTPAQAEALAEIYPSLPAKSIDFGVMEKAAGVHMFVSGFGWSDVGSWQAVHQLSAKDGQENALGNEAGPVLALDSRGNLVQAATKKVVALLGVEGLAVVETENALLVLDLKKSQEVGRIVEKLKAMGRLDLV